MKNTDLIKVFVSLYAEAENSWKLLVDHSDNKETFSRAVWIPKKVCVLEKDPDDHLHYILSAPKWLLDKNLIKYEEVNKDLWKLAISDKIAEATKFNQIKPKLKKLAKELLEFDSEFDLIYSGSRMSYIDIIFRKEVSNKVLYFILKNYGTIIFFKIRDNKRLW